MYYEEKIINGVLCYRTTPDDFFRPLSRERMTERIIDLENKLKMVSNEA